MQGSSPRWSHSLSPYLTSCLTALSSMRRSRYPRFSWPYKPDCKLHHLSQKVWFAKSLTQSSHKFEVLYIALVVPACGTSSSVIVRSNRGGCIGASCTYWSTWLIARVFRLPLFILILRWRLNGQTRWWISFVCQLLDRLFLLKTERQFWH